MVLFSVVFVQYVSYSFLFFHIVYDFRNGNISRLKNNLDA